MCAQSIQYTQTHTHAHIRTCTHAHSTHTERKIRARTHSTHARTAHTHTHHTRARPTAQHIKSHIIAACVRSGVVVCSWRNVAGFSMEPKQRRKLVRKCAFVSISKFHLLFFQFYQYVLQHQNKSNNKKQLCVEFDKPPGAHPCWFALCQRGAENDWPVTYLTVLPHIPVLFMTSLIDTIDTKCQKSHAVTVIFSRHCPTEDNKVILK